MYSVREPALYDSNFLLEMDNYPIREQYCKIVVLKFDESPLYEITGNIISGSLTIDGSSACRRTVNLQMVTEDLEVNNIDWEIRTKYALYIGLKNFVNSKYNDIIWFPQGIFITTSLSTTNNMQGLIITLQGKDKMCLLDGSVGGAIFADHDFGKIDVVNLDGTTTHEELAIPTIIREAIHTYAHESYENIIINDLDDVAVELLSYNMRGQGAFIYDISTKSDFSTYTSDFALDTDTMGLKFLNEWNYTDADEYTRIYHEGDYYYRVQKHLTYGDTAGYRRTELIYPEEFVIQAGGSITSMLDKIIKLLGEFEYYYDVYGRFIFQRKKIYHNISWNGIAETEGYGYFKSSDNSQVVYDLAYGQNVASYQNKPNLLNVRNDWVIWGEIGGTEKNQYPCHLRYSIDDKPIIYHCLNDDQWYRVDTKYTYNKSLSIWQETLSSGTIEINKSDERIDMMARDQTAIEEDYRLAQLPYGFVSSRAVPMPDWSKFWGVKYNSTTNTTTCVDWRELLYRMAIDYGQARSRIETLTSARDNTTILNIVDINRLISLYPDTSSQYPATSGETPLGHVLCGNLATVNNLGYNDNMAAYWPGYNAALNSSQHYYGFWIWDNTIKRFRHIEMDDLAKVNEKRAADKKTLITWSQWLRTCNKEIFFSLQSDDDYFTMNGVLGDEEGSDNGVVARNVYSNVPVKGLGYVNNATEEELLAANVSSFDESLFNLSNQFNIDYVYNIVVNHMGWDWSNKQSEQEALINRFLKLKKRANHLIAMEKIIKPQDSNTYVANLQKMCVNFEVNRINAFKQEIQRWEERLSSRYEIYFADLLAFWPIVYKTVNDLSESYDLRDDDLNLVYSRSNSNIQLSLIDIISQLSNYATTYKTLNTRTDISSDERIFKIRAALNTLWKALIIQYTKLRGTQATHNLRIGNQFIEQIDLYNNVSSSSVSIPENYSDIDVHESATLQRWKDEIESCIVDILTLIKPSDAMTNQAIDPEYSGGMMTRFNQYKNGYGSWIGVSNTALQFEEEQKVDSRSLLDVVYKRWEENGFWDPDVISYNINPNITEDYNLLKFIAPESMLFWFDFLNADSELGKYKISVIGHRSKVVNDNNVKAIFFRDTPNVLFMEPGTGQPEEHNLSYIYLQLNTGLAQYFQISKQGKSAKEELENLLYQTTYYQDSITINCLPIYYIETNQRIRTVDNNSGICGEYIIKSLNISLAYDGMMSIQANKAADRII